MLNVNAAIEDQEVADIRIMNEQGQVSEIVLNDQLKLELTADLTTREHVLVHFVVFEHSENEGFVQTSNPAMLTKLNETATMKFSVSDGTPISISFTPEV